MLVFGPILVNTIVYYKTKKRRILDVRNFEISHHVRFVADLITFEHFINLYIFRFLIKKILSVHILCMIILYSK